MFKIVSVTLADDVCENTYLLSDTTCYLAWDGTHIGRDSVLNIWDGSITTKDSGSCKVSFEPGGTSSLKVCVTVEEFHIEDCNATVNYYHHGDSEKKAVLSLFLFLNSKHIRMYRTIAWCTVTVLR